MPYPGVPDSQTDEMERCVTKVMADGHDKSSAIAICHASVVGKEVRAATLSVHKSADGRYRWMLISSNSFEDRDREIVSQAALEADVARAERQKDYGPLVWWHLNGRVNPRTGEKARLLKLGDCDFNMMYGRVLVEAGTFDDWRFAEGAMGNEKSLAVSIGFNFPPGEPDAEGVFHNITRYERSLLPREFASNPFTSFAIADKELTMPTEAEKVKAFSEYMHVDEATGLKMLAAAEQAEKDALAANARHKAKADDKPEPEDKPNGTDAAADKPFAKDEAEDDEDPKKAKAEMKEWRALTTAAITALVEKVDALATQTAEKAVSEKATADAIAAVKQTAEKALTTAQELAGELPRRLADPLAAFRPSLNGAPVREILKEAVAAGTGQPHSGSMEKHFAALGLGASTTPAIPAPPTPGN